MSRFGKVLWVAFLCMAAVAASRFVWADAAESKTPMLRHVVLFQFNENVEPGKLQEIVAAFRALPGKIDAIRVIARIAEIQSRNKMLFVMIVILDAFDA